MIVRDCVALVNCEGLMLPCGRLTKHGPLCDLHADFRVRACIGVIPTGEVRDGYLVTRECGYPTTTEDQRCEEHALRCAIRGCGNRCSKTSGACYEHRDVKLCDECDELAAYESYHDEPEAYACPSHKDRGTYRLIGS